MAIPYVQSIDLNDFQMLNFVVHSAGTSPTNASSLGGMMWWDSTNYDLKVYNDNDTAWNSLVQGPASSTNNYIPQWNGTGGNKLANGLLLATTVGNPGVDTTLVTEQGIREALDAIAISALEDIGDVAAYSTLAAGEMLEWSGSAWVHQTKVELGMATFDGASVTGNVPYWNDTNGLLNDGYSVETTLTGGSTALARADAIKAYVDSVASGLDLKESVVANSTDTSTEGTGYSYNATGGTSGRGQITWTTGPTTIDGVTIANDDRILNSETGAAGGIWVRTAQNTWDRATDFDEDDEVTSGAYCFVEEGTLYADTGWVLATNDPITIGGAGGTSLTWTQFSGAGTYTAGDGLDLTGTEFSVDLKANGGLVIESTELAVDLGATSFTGALALTNLASYADGSIIIGGAADWESLAAGTTGYVLTMGASRPEWSSPGAPAAHQFLGTSHSDTATHTVARGDLIVGTTATPVWDALSLSVDVSNVLRTDGTDVYWGDLDFADLGTTPTTLSGYGISDTQANFNTALSDGSFAFDGGAHHDGFSDFVANEHINHTSVTITAGSGLSYSVGGTDISASATIDLDINSLGTETTIADGDFVPFWDITVTATNKKITFSNLVTQIEANLTSFATVVSGDVASGASPTITHSLNKTEVTDIIVQIWRQSDNKLVGVEITGATADTVTVNFGSAAINPTLGTFRYVITGIQE